MFFLKKYMTIFLPICLCLISELFHSFFPLVHSLPGYEVAIVYWSNIYVTSYWWYHSFFCCCFVLFFFYFYLPHNNYKKYRKRRKKKWRGDVTETIGAYERLGLLEFWARAVSHQLKKRRRKVKDGKTLWTVFILTQWLNLQFFLKRGEGLRIDELVVKWIKNGPWKKGENFFMFVWQYGRR